LIINLLKFNNKKFPQDFLFISHMEYLKVLKTLKTRRLTVVNSETSSTSTGGEENPAYEK
jgi:hypothetical protein